MKRLLPVLVRVGAMLAIVVVGLLLGRSYYECSRSATLRALMRSGLEDVTRRVRSTSENLKEITQLNNGTMLAKARALAQLVAADASLLTDRRRFKELTKTLGVDELHVTDERGVLIASVPECYIGGDLTTSEQTRPFLPAISDRNFELVQEPMVKGLRRGQVYDKEIFQYAGVARLDSPGIVQVGQLARKLLEARKLADIGEIARTSRVGLSGSVNIIPTDTAPVTDGTFTSRPCATGGRQLFLQRDCEGWRVIVSDTDPSGPLARREVIYALAALEVALILWMIFLNATSRRWMGETVEVLRTVIVGTGKRGFLLRVLKNPITLVATGLLLVVIATMWMMLAHLSRNSIMDIMRSAANDMRDDINECVDNLLFYQGESICRHYQTPELMGEKAINEVMRMYALDELNVVNSAGIVIMGALAERGFDMGSNPLTAKFNCLLHGEKTYSQPFRGAVEDPTLRRKYAGIAFPPPAQGYIQIGFDESRLKHGIDFWFAGCASSWHVSESGYFIVAQEDTGIIDSCGLYRVGPSGRLENACRPGATLSEIGFDVTQAPTTAGKFFEATLFGERCLCLTYVQSFRRVICAVPCSEITDGIRETVMLTAFILLVFLLVVAVFLVRLSDLVSSLKEEKAATNAARSRELAAARTIQMSSLPVVLPGDCRYRISAEMHTAREVGGDFYDFYVVPSGRLFFLIADVSGKGISAAMFMMKAKAIIKACAFEKADFAEAVAEANARLAEANDAEMFVTCWFAAVDLATGRLEFVNAGHNPPLLKRADGSVEWLRSKPGRALAAWPASQYHTETRQLRPGDRMLLYTDGVTEAMNAAGELFGEERLEKTIAEERGSLPNAVNSRIAGFVNGAEQSDDITILDFQFLV